MKLPALEKAVMQRKTRCDVKKEPLEDAPDIIEIDSDEETKNIKSSPHTKDVKVSLETLRLKPAATSLVIRHPQTARRGAGLCLGSMRATSSGKTSDNKTETAETSDIKTENKTYNEFEVAQTLVGLKDAQPKSGNICKLQSAEKKTEDKPSKLKLKRVPRLTKHTEQLTLKDEPKEEEAKKDEPKKDGPSDNGKPEGHSEVSKSPANYDKEQVDAMHLEVEEMIQQRKTDVDITSHMDTLKGILVIEYKR